MGQIETWKEVKKRKADELGEPSTGVKSQNFIVDASIKVACYVATLHPDNYSQSTPFFRSLIDYACETNGEDSFPERPDLPFEGGQCEGVLYDVIVVADVRFSGNTTRREYDMTAYGNIESIALEYQPPESPNQLAIVARGQSGAGNSDGVDLDNVGGVGFSATIVSISVQPRDGAADNCGNLPGAGEYPPSGEIPDSEKCFSLDFDGETVEFCLTDDSPSSTKVCFDSGDYIVCLDEDGINIESKEKQVGEKPFDEEDFDEEDAECTPPEDIQLEADGSPPEGVKECEGSTEELKWLLVTVTKDPIKGQTIVYPNPNDDHMFAGWVAWKIVNGGQPFFLPAEPIRKRNNAFRPPDDINGYNVYSTNGARLSIKELKETKQNASRNV